MHTTTRMEKQAITSKVIDSWKLSEDGEKLHSSNAVIDAYFKGKQEGLDQAQKALQKLFENNYLRSGECAKSLIDYLKSSKLHPISAHLKIESLFTFEVIVLLPEEEFLSDAMKQVYSHCRDLEIKYCDDSFQISFNFIDASSHFDFAQLKADGFEFKLKD